MFGREKSHDRIAVSLVLGKQSRLLERSALRRKLCCAALLNRKGPKGRVLL